MTTDMRYPAHQEPATVGPATTGETLDQILRQARQAFVCDAVGVSGDVGGRVKLAAASEPAVREADQLQLSCGDGPSLRQPSDADICLSGDTRGDERWPRWGPQVAELGWLSFLSAPLVTPAHRLGTLNLYARRPSAFDATHEYAARLFAQYAATALAHAIETTDLREAAAARHRVGLAQGILMEQHGIDAEAAFDMLRHFSQHHNVKLLAVAQHLVETGSLPAAVSRRGRHRSGRAA